MWNCEKYGEKMEDQFVSCWKCALPQGGSHTDAPRIPSGGDEDKTSELFASEIARQRKLVLEHRARVKIPGTWSVALFIAGIASGGSFWFRGGGARDNDDARAAFAIGIITWFIGSVLSTVLFFWRRQSTECPQCGYDWDAPQSEAVGQDWLHWKSCPGCGLKMR